MVNTNNSTEMRTPVLVSGFSQLPYRIMNDNFPPANVQGLSAILSLLGSDSVEQKLSSLSSSDAERMSSVWSVFGMLGAFRHYLKIAAGLANSEKAGAALADAAVYTHRRTKSSSCYWAVNRKNSPASWRSSKDELLSLMGTTSGITGTSESTWLRPIFIAIGYTRCPWDWGSKRCTKEFVNVYSCAVLSLSNALIPAIVLLSSQNKLSTGEVITLYLQVAVSLFSGTLPIIIDRFNAPGIEHLSQLYHDRLLAKSVSLLRDGDLVMADSSRKEAHIVWQTPNTENHKASGDVWWIRALSALSCLLILGAYLGNYNALANATRGRQYMWLIVQIFVFILRYTLWSRKPGSNPHRPSCLLYLATGSLVEPLPATPSPERVHASNPNKLALTVINFAVAAAISKAHDGGSEPVRYRPELYARMANTAPSDIISGEYVQLAEHFSVKNRFGTMSVLRLSWAVVEEMYRAQGVILGPNPWAYGGLYLGAVFVENTFVGLTTVHPFQLHVQHCTDKLCISRHEDYQEGGFTRDGYFLSDLICGTVVGFACHSNDSVTEWHDMFRSNVTRCRETSRPNGPSYTEIHAATSGLKPSSKQINVSRVEPALNFGSIQASAYDAMTKSHHDCRPDLCEVYTFGGNHIRVPDFPK